MELNVNDQKLTDAFLSVLSFKLVVLIKIRQKLKLDFRAPMR